jgi:hypothetical protein
MGHRVGIKEVIGGSALVLVEEETLSDGSKVYNVRLKPSAKYGYTMNELQCIDKEHAFRLFSMIGECC